jgi:hypothetical protein
MIKAVEIYAEFYACGREVCLFMRSEDGKQATFRMSGKMAQGLFDQMFRFGFQPPEVRPDVFLKWRRDAIARWAR